MAHEKGHPGVRRGLNKGGVSIRQKCQQAVQRNQKEIHSSREFQYELDTELQDVGLLKYRKVLKKAIDKPYEFGFTANSRSPFEGGHRCDESIFNDHGNPCKLRMEDGFAARLSVTICYRLLAVLEPRFYLR